MNYLAIGIIAVIIYICFYSLIDRVCKCIEHCANAKSFTRTADAFANELKKRMSDASDDKK